jgi:RNA polymerase sigma-32 factor
MANKSLPTLTPEGSLTAYLHEIRKFPMLKPAEEFMLAKAWTEHGDTDAAHKLVTSHLRLVAKIAMGYRGYGLPVGDLISEGNVGMMQAVKRFDPDRGFRLATYAMWWIKASIHEYILRSWSLVKIGTTAAQKKLFFNLRRIKGQLEAVDEGDLHPDQMNRRMAGSDHSLNAPMRADIEGEWQDWLVDENTPDQETAYAASEEMTYRRGLMANAMGDLNKREQHIITERRLTDEPKTLETLSLEYNISRERVRQIEARAFEKLQAAMKIAAEEDVITIDK